jgi:hypothetical protein
VPFEPTKEENDKCIEMLRQFTSKEAVEELLDKLNFSWIEKKIVVPRIRKSFSALVRKEEELYDLYSELILYQEELNSWLKNNEEHWKINAMGSDVYIEDYDKWLEYNEIWKKVLKARQDVQNVEENTIFLQM